ncbi:MAG: 5-oxoprolinase subunit PxpB [Candidatus Kapaibacteriota bacterium]
MIASALPDIRIIPCGDAALTLLCAEEISLDAFQTVQRLRALLEHPPLPAVREIVPAFTSLTLLLDIPALAAISAEPLASFLSCLFDRLAAQNIDSPALLKHDDTVVNIPICYNEEYAPDIREMALRKGLSVAEIIKLHTEAEYQVAMIGFTPGFPYLLGLPPELAMPRKDTPRARVNAGAVGIAGAQTGIYPLESPGGWNIIGQTPLELFSLEKARRNEAPTLVRTGDRVRFYAVSSLVEEPVSPPLIPTLLREGERGYSMPSLSEGAVVLQSGFQTTIQDAGRTGWREYGIPQSGAADTISFRLANLLVGNSSNDAALEVLWGKLTIRFEQDALIALTGAPTSAEAHLDGIIEPVPMNRPLCLVAGTTLVLHGAERGLRTYCAVAGGIDVPLVLGSRSTYSRAGLGGMAGRVLAKGDRLRFGDASALGERIFAGLLRTISQRHLVEGTIPTRITRPTAAFSHSSAAGREEIFDLLPHNHPQEARKRTVAGLQLFPQKPSSIAVATLPHSLSCSGHIVGGKPVKLRVVRGGEYETLTEASKHQLFGEELRVLPNSDRMGIRLRMTGKQGLERVTTEQIISRAVLPGTVQLPPSGEPILLLTDAQTTGGYPVVAHVCSVDLPKAAQMRPNETLIFEEIALEEAQKLYIEAERWQKSLEKRLQTWLVCNLA